MDTLMKRMLGGRSHIPYHPPPSIGHEIGVMFAGFATMVIGMYIFFSSLCLHLYVFAVVNARCIGAGLFYLWWQWNLKRELVKEEERVRDLKNRGLFDQRD